MSIKQLVLRQHCIEGYSKADKQLSALLHACRTSQANPNECNNADSCLSAVCTRQYKLDDVLDGSAPIPAAQSLTSELAIE